MTNPCVSAKLIALTQPVIGFPASGPEGLIAHCARVSSDREYEDRGKDYEKLFNYCIKHKHYSVFEMANAVVEVKAPRDISRQLLRHRSFHFQEFSQRYSDDIEFCEREVRLQDTTNRQNSLEVDNENYQSAWASGLNGFLYGDGTQVGVNILYREALEFGFAKECVRVILPEGLTMSILYVNGTMRDWFHYLDVREGNGTQKEHIMLAKAIRQELIPAVPSLFERKPVE
jgi:thymidylate synthase (FAD)